MGILNQYRQQVSPLFLLALVALGRIAFGLAAQYLAEEDMALNRFPAEIRKAVSEGKRVYGKDQFDMTWFYIKGTRKELNDCLRQLAKVTDVDARLEIAVEAGIYKPRLSEKAKQAFNFDWCVGVEDRKNDYEAVPPNVITTTTDLFRAVEAGKVRPVRPRWRIYVEVYLDGKLDLETLEVPLLFDVHAGGKLGNFLSDHRMARAVKAEEEAATAPKPATQPRR